MNKTQQTSPKDINKRPKKAFTAKEDQLIVFFVNLLGTKKWSSIANYVNGRTAKQCRDRYMNYLKPGLTNIEWTKKEDDLLLELYNKFGSKWSSINKYFVNRNQVSLKNRLLFLQKHIDNNGKIKYLIDHKRKTDDLNIQQNSNNENSIKRIKYPLPNIKLDSKRSFDDNYDSNLNNPSSKSNEMNKDDPLFDLDNIFEFSDEFSSYYIFKENEFGF